MEKPTAGWNLHFDGTSDDEIVGALLEWDDAMEGDTEDVSGTGDTQNGIVRRKGKPVDKGRTFTATIILDTEATNHDDFVSAMDSRTEDAELSLLRDGEGYTYIGHSDSFNETGTRSEATWKANLTFYVNEREEVSGS